MKRRSIIIAVTTVVMIVAGLMLTVGCKKQPRCGCRGDAIGELKETPIMVFFDLYNKTAWCYDGYASYYFCNPSEWMDFLKDFKSGQELKVSGQYFWDCTYQMNVSGSGYMYGPPVYQIQVKALSLDEFGK